MLIERFLGLELRNNIRSGSNIFLTKSNSNICIFALNVHQDLIVPIMQNAKQAPLHMDEATTRSTSHVDRDHRSARRTRIRCSAPQYATGHPCTHFGHLHLELKLLNHAGPVRLQYALAKLIGKSSSKLASELQRKCRTDRPIRIKIKKEHKKAKLVMGSLGISN